ncbi:uncharacterized protein LOC130442135 [Diorhabda sublineata]|uniref:uncharacterized protein LOC130442135 n=1 Tax=Diorhabda sublineata TaxID=1163346 RepID=UPI0024E1863D|nr:uncharacterized protein LOC130442135 [Diorhabda sublineata]
MERIEINTDYDSNSSSSTIIDEANSSIVNVNFRGSFNGVSKNIYDLSEFEETSEICEKSYINNETCSELLKGLSQKYSPVATSISSQANSNPIIVLSDSSSNEGTYSEDILNGNEIFENQQNNFMSDDNNDELQNKSYSKTQRLVNKCIAQEKDIKTDNGINKIKNGLKRTINYNENDIEEDVRRKGDKKKQKDQKLSKEKQRDIKKSSNPEKLLEDIIVNIDESTFNNVEYGSTIIQQLENCGVAYRKHSSLIGVISWSRKIYSTDNSIPEVTEQKETHYLIILLPHQFGSLLQLILNIKEHTNFHHLTVLIYSLNKPTFSQEEEMIQLDINFPIFWQYVPTKEDLASFVFMATKSVAQIPYKKQQEEKYKLQSEYFNDANKDVVKVDRKGNGLSRLWCQMLTMFPLARLETAEAIMAEYPTMSSFFQAYKDCADTGEVLIQNLPIRRALGPTATVKKLGPELSRKCYRHFTSEENIFL